MMLDALERDAVTELLNVAVSRSAAALSRMVGKPVAMSVPDVRILSRAEALDTIAGNRNTSLIAVGEQFSGPFSGRALLVFPETRSLHLVQAIVGEHLTLEEIADLEEDAMIEVGNVILNNCLSGIANMLGCRIEATLPHCFQGGGERIFKRTIRDDDDGIILFTSIDFSIRDRDIGGFIILLMDLNAISNLRNAVARYVDGIRRSLPDPHSP
ncbi:chemotaxis protein CheC [Azospirillum fermentarium]|uniref:chemotaxis protein CheX n=1 Tax=Azospirillum fermentarium TaxID=1233114 RepID=UPI0022265675|nr:chemotaxis protein CheX [Azospirillum fermentarium]MCW2248634.1 chemotaxis protein CheC [Azospirillum fermentarium]